MICPACGSDGQGEPVPDKYLHHNIPGEPWYDPKKEDCRDQKARWAARHPGEERCFCLPYGEITHFSRFILVEVLGVYDGGLYYVCPDCDHAFHRWTDPHMRSKAQFYIDQHNTTGDT